MSEKQPNLDRRDKGARARGGHRLIRAVLALLVTAVAVACVWGIVGVLDVALHPVAPHEQAQTQELQVSDTLQQDNGAPEEEPEPEPEVPAEPVEIKLMMIGDVLMHMGVIEGGYQADGSLNYDHLFAHIADDVAEADVAVLNQETILGGARWPYAGYPAFNSPQEVGEAEVAVGFDVVLKATNHTFDYGYDGVRAELAYWAASHPQMAVIGMADPDGKGVAPTGGTSPAGPYIFERDGFKVALLNYTDVLNGNVDPSFDGHVVSLMTEEGIRSDVAAAREQADLVVVFTHWGEEYETVPVESERYWAGVLQEAGADVVIGGHPHVIQPVEVWGEGSHKMLICWSVGNFVSTQDGAANMVGGMVKLDLIKDADGARVKAYEFVPTVTHRVRSSSEMSGYKLRDYTDELAARNSVWQIDGGRGSTVAWYADFCAEVLGEGFDYTTMSLHGTL